MFERFGDLPLHVLVIHLAVVVLPVSALTAIAFAVLPKWRWLLRWPALVLGLGALVCAFVAKKSGETRPECWEVRGLIAHTTVMAVLMKQARHARATTSRMTKSTGAQEWTAPYLACASRYGPSCATR